MKKPTIGSENCYPFEQRGSKKPINQWTANPRNTMAPQQYGYGVTPQTMVKPTKPGEFRAGVRPEYMNVGRPGRK